MVFKRILNMIKVVLLSSCQQVNEMIFEFNSRSQRSITSTYPYYDDFDNSSNPRQSHDHPIDQNFESKEKLNNNELTYSNAGRDLDNAQQPEQTTHSNQQNMVSV